MNEEEVWKMGFPELWRVFRAVVNMNDEYEAEMDRVKNGFIVRVPMRHLLEEQYEVYGYDKKVGIFGYGKYPLPDFYEDLDRREDLMRNVILRNIEKESTVAPRS